MIASQIGRMKSASGGVSPPATLTVNITTDKTDYNLFTAAGSPGTAKTVVVNISSGVYIRASSTSNNAFDEGNGWATGTTITINNSGNIIGMGGAGGAGGNSSVSNPSPPYGATVAGNNGSAGGTALRLTAPTSIANAAGAIFGGGGGGGGAGGVFLLLAAEEGSFEASYGGGGGGGGQGANSASAGAGGVGYLPTNPVWEFDGSAGSSGSSSPGSGGAGGSSNALGYIYTIGSGGAGGAYGDAGSTGGTPSVPPEYTYYGIATPGIGGNPGRSVNTNGQSLTWLSGNVPSRVKGPQY